jgi:SAM-dependent methyltransferase
MAAAANRARREAEPRKVPAEKLELLRGIEAEIRPDDPALADWTANYCRQHRDRLAGDLRLVERFVAAGAAVLECGAVPLLTTAALAKLGYAVRAVDLAPERFASVIERLGLDVRRCDIEREALPFEAGAFSAVLFHEIFEHLRIDPIHTLREVHRVLAPDGILLLSTPNLRSFRGLRNLWLHHRASTGPTGLYEQYEKLASLGHMGHVREYTAREVTAFLARIGFRVETVIYRGGHGRGPVGLAERFVPSMRPSFSLVATRIAEPTR